jgi:hypothetical protein
VIRECCKTGGTSDERMVVGKDALRHVEGFPKGREMKKAAVLPKLIPFKKQEASRANSLVCEESTRVAHCSRGGRLCVSNQRL